MAEGIKELLIGSSLPRRARVDFSDLVMKQVETVSTTADGRRIDRVLAVLAANPLLGDETPQAMMRSYWDEAEQVRVVYFLTALQTRILVSYLEW
jgi:hypothetical protein